MNYEFTIRRLEAELAHVREIQAIHREHMEALDKGHEYTGTRLAAIEAALETLTVNVNKLVTALLREHPNGHADQK